MAESVASAEDQATYTRVGWTLLGGLLASIAVMAIGFVLTAIRGTGGVSHVLPLDRVLPQLRAGNADALLDLGILLLFATPLLGVLVALVEFIRQRDTVFSAVTAMLLAMLAAAFAIALR